MRYRKLIIITISIVMLLFPINIFAKDGETKNLFINIDILENGDINVQELASLKGEYNGRYRNIEFANISAKKFTGAESDFEGSDIYNGSSLTSLALYDVRSRNSITYNSLFNTSLRSKKYIKAINPVAGARGLYLITEKINGIDLKIFNPSTTDTAFYMEYTIKNAVVVHNDVAELAWNILGTGYEDNIDNMEVHINLPREDDTLKVWLRGPLNGEIENINNKYAKITYNFLGARNAVSARVMFDKNLVPYANKLSRVNGKDHILAVEKKAADIANLERKRIKTQNNIVKVITIIWYIVIFITSIIFYKEKKKSDKTNFDAEYLREFPADYGPEILEYLLKATIDEKAMSASILMIIQKDALQVEKIKKEKDNYTLIKKEDKLSLLTEEEKILLHLLIDTIGDGDKVTLKQIKSYGKNTSKAKKFIAEYNRWKTKSELIAKNEQFYKKSPTIKVVLVLISLIGLIIELMNITLETGFIPGYFSIIISIIVIIFSLLTNFKTEKGALHTKKWLALKKFMKDFGTMDIKELPELKLWGKYLVYATVLGCAKELEKTMKVRINDISGDTSLASYYMLDSFTDNIFIMSSITSSINNSVVGAVSSSRSSIASSSYSSSSGGGGGASFGGGSFGGGGGGGHF